MKQEGGTIHLPPTKGGKPLTVNLGPVPSDTKLEPLSQKEALQLSSKNHLYGEQQTNIMADLRTKWGRNVVEPGLKEVIPLHNKKLT